MTFLISRETLGLLADLASGAMVAVMFLAFAALTALLWMAWRGLRLARVKLRPAVGRIAPYVALLSAETARAEHEVIAPQVEALAWQAGLRAGLRALVAGRAADASTLGADDTPRVAAP